MISIKITKFPPFHLSFFYSLPNIDIVTFKFIVKYLGDFEGHTLQFCS